MQPNELAEPDKIAFEEDFGTELLEKIAACTDEFSLEILIAKAQERLNELQPAGEEAIGID